MARPASHRRFTIVVAALLAATPLAASAEVTAPPGTAVTTSTDTGSCPTPPDPQPVPDFTDIAGSPHEANIACVARWGIAQGTGPRTYAPRRDVTRAQMASFVANLVRATGADLPEGRDRFRDDDGSPHEANINALANAGIISGVTGGGYAPNRDVTRAQAATILAGTYRHLRGSDLPEGRDRFDDDGPPHESNINRLANADVINGLTATRFGHADPLKRDQMAALLARFLPLTVGGGFGTGTLWYADYNLRGTEGRYELIAIEADRPTERRVVHSAPSSSFHAVNVRQGEFAHIDLSFDGAAGEPRNQVYVRSLADNRTVKDFRWGDQCEGRLPNESARQVSAPLGSPDGRWFAAEARYGSPTYLYGLEIRGDDGGCQLKFGHLEVTSWTWTADGDLLVVIDSDALPGAVGGDRALATIPRADIEAGQVRNPTVLRTYADPDVPTGIALSNDQRRVAYTFRDELYVLDRASGDDRRVAHSANSLINPAFAPDDRSIVVRHRTFDPFPGQGEVHLVPAAPSTPTPVRSGGPTQLAVPVSPGAAPSAFDARGQFFWQP